MDSALTSLISNSTKGLILGALFFPLACSTPKVEKKSADEESLALDEELNSLSKKVQIVNFGPTQKVGTLFTDKTEAYGLSGLQAVSFNAVDLNFDGQTDLVLLPTYYSRPKFMIFDPVKKRFSPSPFDPLPEDFKSSFLVIVDMNKDTIPDLLSVVLNQRSEVSQIPIKYYRGEMVKGYLSFKEGKDAFTIPAEPTSSLSVLDYDLDGWPDIFVGNWFETKKGQHLPVADRLFRNVKGKFVEVTNLLRGEANKNSDQLYPQNARPTYGSSTCDIDQNGFPDIMTVSSSGYKNKLWMNLQELNSGDRYFDDVGPVSNYASDPDGSLIPTGGGRSFFSACTDYNDDGIMDMFLGELSHAYDNDSVDKSSVLTGARETYPPYFMRTEYLSDATSESWNQGDRRALWVDYNIDGYVDLVVDNSGFPPYSRLVLFEQDETRAFLNVGSRAGIDMVNPTGTITIDLNQDGLPDFITSQNKIRKADIAERLYVFENNSERTGKRSIKVHLHGIKSNASAIGAMVMLYTQAENKKIVQRRWVELSQGGLPSQNESGTIFGVSSGVEAVGVKVRWPFSQRNGLGSGVVLEKLYSLKSFPEKDYLEFTLCEDGKVLSGKTTCQL
ncbi:MAG: VCBS repeat-containing protein [Bdellovibrionota bacterium]